MALSADEQRLLDSLTAKANEPAAGPAYNSVEKILAYVIQHAPFFTTNPDDRQVMLDFLNGVIEGTASSDTPSVAN